MSRKYKFTDQNKLYFVSFAVINWIDLFIRKPYKDIVVNSLAYCGKEKGLELYGWCIMTSHVHLIMGTSGNPMQDIIRDLKRHTSEELHKAIAENKTESRREWLLWMMERAGKKNGNNGSFQLWQQHNQPIELRDNKMAHQKLEYLHYNPVEAGFVWRQEDWLYSRAIDYNEGKGLLPTLFLDLLIL